MSFYINKILEFVKNKKICLLGLGKSNIAIASVLNNLNVDFEVRDKNDCSEKLKKFKNSKIKKVFFENYLVDIDSDIIFLSPGIRPDIKELKLAVNNGAILSSEIDLFLRCCPTKNIFAITGSDGKSTTSSLVYELLKKSGKDAFLGGNIGIPVISQVKDISSNSYVVLELSSFQLMNLKINPKVAVITNISENHLDWHLSFNEYINSKFNIFKNQSCNNLLVVNHNDKISNKVLDICKSKIREFSLDFYVNNGCFIENNGDIIFSNNGQTKKVINKQDLNLLGDHNLENFLASVSACIDYVDINSIEYVAKNFKGLEHRIEFVDEINCVKYYNDSIASTPTRVIRGALSIFQNNIILIAGGYDKHLSFEKFAKIVCDKVKLLILIGQTSEKIEKCINDLKSDRKPMIFKSSSMSDAVNLANLKSSKGDVVLLSPACASFGMYNNFEERGNDFKNCVLNLKKEVLL